MRMKKNVVQSALYMEATGFDDNDFALLQL